jgi:protein-disulfide isomerase
MKKLMLVVAMLAVVLVAAVPALAQVSQEFSERRDTSGSASPKVAVSNTGDNVNLCPTVQQVAQTGQVLNEQGVVQYFSTADDLDFTGSSLTVGTENAPADLTATCDQTINQAAASG